MFFNTFHLGWVMPERTKIESKSETRYFRRWGDERRKSFRWFIDSCISSHAGAHFYVISFIILESFLLSNYCLLEQPQVLWTKRLKMRALAETRYSHFSCLFINTFKKHKKQNRDTSEEKEVKICFSRSVQYAKIKQAHI